VYFVAYYNEIWLYLIPNLVKCLLLYPRYMAWQRRGAAGQPCKAGAGVSLRAFLRSGSFSAWRELLELEEEPVPEVSPLFQVTNRMF
jgi:hypothetical protein